MTTYKCSIGLNVVTLDLVAIDPQPRSEGIKYVRRVNAASGAVTDQSAYVELQFSALGSVTQYQALLTQFGILSSLTSPVTVLVRSEIWSFTRYNGLAIRPQMGDQAKWSYMPRDVTILIRNLEQLVEA